MAESKLRSTEEPSNADLVQCGICFAVIDKPKALPCLHTFCLKCLTSWVESSAKKNPDKYTNAVSCPNCREDFPLPKGGAKEFKTNFFVSKLKERNSIQKKLHEKNANIPCTSCDPSDSKAIGRCVECDDFLCKKCIDNHKSMRVLRQHHVLTLDELRAGKLTMHNLPEQEICPKHTGEVLRFYCETCDEPMCRDCTVLDHPRPDHKQIDLKSAAGERNDKLQELFNTANPVPKSIETAIEEDKKTLKDLEANAEKAIRLYKTTVKKAEVAYTQRVRELVAKRRKEIEAHQESLQYQNARLRTALEMTKQVTQNGSEHDVATMYSSLSDTMQQLCKLKPKGIRKTMGKVEFSPNKDLSSGVSSPGVLNTYEQWTLDKTFGTGQFSQGRGIIVDTNSDVMVATYSSGHYIKVFGEDGTYKRQIDTVNMGEYNTEYDMAYEDAEYPYGYPYPWGMALSQGGDCYITDQNPYVKIVYANNGAYKNRFGAQNTNGSWSYNDGSQLHGLAVDSKDRLYVGCTNYNYISIHDQNGTRVSGFNVKLSPYFIVVTPEDHVIVSDYCNSPGVHVYDANGTQLHTFAAPPEGKFYPTGLCVADDEIFVASYQGVPAVYRYSRTGDYIGVVTKDVANPWGIAIKDGGEELLVCEDSNIKIFHP